MPSTGDKCSQRWKKCPEDQYCDLVINYCEPCSRICRKQTRDLPDCEHYCPGYYERKFEFTTASGPDKDPVTQGVALGQVQEQPTNGNLIYLVYALVAIAAVLLILLILFILYFKKRLKNYPRDSRSCNAETQDFQGVVPPYHDPGFSLASGAEDREQGLPRQSLLRSQEWVDEDAHGVVSLAGTSGGTGLGILASGSASRISDQGTHRSTCNSGSNLQRIPEDFSSEPRVRDSSEIALSDTGQRGITSCSQGRVSESKGQCMTNQVGMSRDYSQDTGISSTTSEYTSWLYTEKKKNKHASQCSHKCVQTM